MIHCPWCGHLFEPVKRGAHDKRLCSTKCRHDHQYAARRIGDVMAATMKPGSLRDWFMSQTSRATEPAVETESDERRHGEAA